MVEKMLFLMVFITMVSLQRENRLMSLDECSEAVTCKHKGNDLYRSLQHFFLSPGVFFFFLSKDQQTKNLVLKNWKAFPVTLVSSAKLLW